MECLFQQNHFCCTGYDSLISVSENNKTNLFSFRPIPSLCTFVVSNIKHFTSEKIAPSKCLKNKVDLSVSTVRQIKASKYSLKVIVGKKQHQKILKTFENDFTHTACLYNIKCLKNKKDCIGCFLLPVHKEVSTYSAIVQISVCKRTDAHVHRLEYIKQNDDAISFGPYTMTF